MSDYLKYLHKYLSVIIYFDNKLSKFIINNTNTLKAEVLSLQ